MTTTAVSFENGEVKLYQNDINEIPNVVFYSENASIFNVLAENEDMINSQDIRDFYVFWNRVQDNGVEIKDTYGELLK